MKLELKHLLPYLPYRVHLMNKYGSWHNTTLNKSLSIYEMLDMKPMLRPLSDLTKDEFNYLHTLLRIHIGKNKRDKLINEGYGIPDLSYFIFEQLLENHFDLFNLIKNELAIDKNTL